MKWIQRIVRWILLVLLLWGIFTETGVWTVFAFGLILVSFEILGWEE